MIGRIAASTTPTVTRLIQANAPHGIGRAHDARFALADKFNVYGVEWSPIDLQ